MANWLHKTTLEYRRSNDPPLEEQSSWIRNPVLPNGVDSWEEVIVENDTVRARTFEESLALTASRLGVEKQRKIAEIDARTASLIQNGSVVVNGESLSTSVTQQVSLLGIKVAIDAGLGSFPRTLSALNGFSYVCPDLADFVRISELVLAFVEGCKASGRVLKSSVLEATTLAEVAAVEDNR